MDRIRKSLAEGRAAFAAWMSLGDTLSAEVLGRAGYDGVILDTQHGGITWDKLAPAIQALDISGVPALVRVGWTDQAQIMRALDVGALGVIVPMVSTAAQARLAAEAALYPPRGVRSFGSVRSGYSLGEGAIEPLCFVMIETAEAVANLDEIASTPGVDGLFVGPVDLGLSLGLGAVLEMHEEVLGVVEQVVAACRRHGKISGSASMGLPYARALLERGVQFVAQGNDLGFIRRGAAAELQQLNAWRDELKTGSTHLGGGR
jgi:4-hydroxy-2-oxoheptanedioate aldolase